MEKIKRIVAYTLVFVLVFGLFAGLGIYGGSQSDESMVKASTSSGETLVWEIVPNTSLASAASVLSGYTVETYTPATLKTHLASNPDSIDAVDLFIINQNGQTSGANSFFASSSTADNWLTWNEAFAIFKKISGANGDPAKFVIDATIYTENSESSTDRQGFALASTPIAGTGGNNDLIPITKSGTGFKNNATKLYTMLKIMDPGTFYGLYFASRGETYGINENNGAIIGYGFKGDDNATVKESGYEVKSWSLERLRPYFMMTSADQSLSTIGWNETGLSTTGYTAGSRGFAFTGSLSSVASTISTLMADAGKTIDAKQYRFLVVEPNEKGSVDRRTAFKMAELAYSANESMVGGVVVDNVSMYNLASYIDKINDKYDCVYFGTTADSNLTGSKEGIVYVFRGNTYTKLGNQYDLKIARYENFSDVIDWVYSGSSRTKSYYTGLDITAEAKSELEAFITAGKPLYYSGILDTTKVDSNTNIATLISSNSSRTNVKSGSFLSGTELASVKNSVKNRLSIVVIDKPVEYYAKIDFEYQTFNDVYDYGTKMRDPGVQYINESSHNNRTMKFKFRVSGASSYKYNFYIDVNNDGRFESNETERKVAAEDLTVSSSGVAKFAYTLGSTFTGAVNWKVEIYDSGNTNNIFSETGCCAVKNYGTADTVNILQIIPVDQGSYTSVKNPAHGVPTNPTLLLPMKDEIRAAIAGKGDLDVSGTIDGSKKSAIESYFSGYLKVQTSGQNVDYTHANYTTINTSYLSDDKAGVMLVANASLFYYFLKKENVCDLNVLRISTEELAARVALSDDNEYKIKIDGNTITYLDPDTKSGTVTCDLLMLGFCDYLLPQNSTVSATSNLGKAIDAIAAYVGANGATFIGGGVLVPNENDYFTKKLLNASGLDRYGITTTGSNVSGVPGYTHFGSFYNTGNDAAAELMKTNKGTIVSYPYTIPDFTQGANAKIQTYQTNVDKVNGAGQNDISVFFCMTNIINSAENYAGFNARGDVVNNYYLFKKGNITYSAVGFNEVAQPYKMKATVIKLPEAALLVNAIVASTSGDPHGHTEEPEETAAPYTVPVDNPGSNELPVKPDVAYVPTVPAGSTVPADLKYDQHTVYVYPEYDGTKEDVSDLISDNPSITSDGKYIFNFEVIIPDGCTSVTIDVFAGGTNLSIPITATNGGTVTGKTIAKADSGKKFKVEIPINSTYYTSKGLNATGSVNKYGLDLTDNFEVKVVTTPNFANPSTSSINGTITSVNVVKRGIFRIN